MSKRKGFSQMYWKIPWVLHFESELAKINAMVVGQA